MSHSFDRRDFLRAAAALAGNGLLGCGSDAQQWLADAAGAGGGGAGGMGSTASGGTDGAGGAGGAGGSGGSVPDELPPGVSTQFPSSLLKASADDMELPLNLIAGKIPGDMHGHMFIASPIPRGGGLHVFNGEAKIIRLDFGNATIGLKSKMLKTPCYYADKAVEGTSRAFQNAGMARFNFSLGFRSQLNTAVVPFGKDRMLATVDAARPYEIDPASLEVITPVGATKEWTAGLPSLIFRGPFRPIFTQAHPFYDAHTDETFCVNYSISIPLAKPFTNLVRWNGEDRIQTFPLKLQNGDPVEIVQAAHQITCTKDYIVILDTAFRTEAAQVVGLGVSAPQMPDTVLYVIRRKDLIPGSDVLARRVVIPRESAHVVADYDNPGQQITVHLAHLTGTDLSEWLRADDVLVETGQKVRSDLVGLFSAGTDINQIGKYVIDGESGQVMDSAWHQDDELTWATIYYMHRGAMVPGRFEQLYYMSFGFSSELYTERVAKLYADHPDRQINPSKMPLEGRPGALFRFDVAAMTIADGYRLPPGRVMSSPQFVPRFGSSGPTDGYIVATVLSDDTTTPGSSGDEIWILDAANLSQGPIARLGHPLLNLGFTIHTTWTESASPRTSSNYLITAREDYEHMLGGLDDELVGVFEKHVFPKFGG